MAPESEEPGPTHLKGVVVSETGQVKVWSTIGMKIPIPDLEGGEFSFEFGHERWAKSSTQEDIRKAAALADDFNQFELERRFLSLLRQIRRNGMEAKDEARQPIPDKELGRMERVRRQAAGEAKKESKKAKKGEKK